MATNAVDIVNDGMLAIGKPALVSMTPVDPVSTQIIAKYESARKELLRMAPFNFSVDQVVLIPDSVNPAFGWNKAYTIPGDCLRVWSIDSDYIAQMSNEASATPFVRRGNKVYTNKENQIYLTYSKDITDVSLFDPLFEHALALKLAYSVAYRVSGDNVNLRDLRALFDIAIGDALFANGEEGFIPDDFYHWSDHNY